MKRNKTFVEKMVIGVFIVVGLLISVQIGLAVWVGAEVVGSVQESGGVKQALIELAKDTKEISDAFQGE